MAKTYKHVKLGETETISQNDLNNKISENISNVYQVKEYITIPPRTERIISVYLDSNEEQICLSREIRKDVYVGNCIMKPENSIGTISVLNTSPCAIKLKTINLQIVPLSNYNILNFGECNKDNDRRKRLYDQIDFSHLNGEEEMAIKEIINDFNHIFHLEGDKLTCTDTIIIELKFERMQSQ